MEEILKKIGQLQYEISCLELDKETLTGVTIRTEELKEFVKNCNIAVVVGQSEQLKAFVDGFDVWFKERGDKIIIMQDLRDYLESL